MTNESTHELRALLLAGLMMLSIVAGSVALAGSAAASHYELEATDGSGGQASTLYTNFSEQLPEGVESGDDTLEVEATGETLPSNGFLADIYLDDRDNLTFDGSQDASDVEVVIFSQSGDTEDGGVEVTNVSPKQIEIDAEYSGGLFGDSDAPVGLRVTNLTFNASDEETATLTWEIGDGETTYAMDVQPFNAGLTATDEAGGSDAAVTAGAKDQRMVGDISGVDERARNLVLEANEDEFPSTFTATANLTGTNVTFNDSSDEVTATVPSGTPESVKVDDHSIAVQVTEFQGDDEGVAIIELENLTYDVPPTEDAAVIEWHVRDAESTTYALDLERLSASFESNSYEFPRGSHREPTNGANLTIDASDLETGGFHDSDAFLNVTLPDDRRHELEFDTSNEPEATFGVLDSKSAEIEAVTASYMTIRVTDDIESGDTLSINGVRFNTSGYEYDVNDGSPDFESGLQVSYAPVDRGDFDDVSLETGDALGVTVPEITIEGSDPTRLSTNETAANGTSEVALKLADETGGQMAPGTDVVVGLNDTDGVTEVTFDESQSGELRITGNNDEFTASAEVDSVSSDEIRIRISEFSTGSQAGDHLLLENKDGQGLRFNASEANVGDVNFTVQTNAGEENVTQVSDDPAVEVTTDNISIDPQVDNVTVEVNETVTVNVTRADDETKLTGVDVTASGPLQDGPVTETSEDGVARFDLTASEPGTISFNASNALYNGTVDAGRANVATNRSTIPAGEKSDVRVWLNRTNGSALASETIVANGTGLNNSVNGTTDENGTVVLTLNASEEGGEIEIDAENLTDVDTIIQSNDVEMVVKPGVVPIDEETKVGVEIQDSNGDPVDEDVEVFAKSSEYEIDENITATSGVGTFTFDLNDENTLDQIVLDATVETNNTTSELEEVVDTVGLRSDVAEIPANGSTPVSVTFEGSDGVDTDDVEVHANSTDIDGIDRTNSTEDGVATFEFQPGNSEDGTIHFTVPGVDERLETTVTSIAPRIVAPDAITYGSVENVSVTVEALNGADGSYVTQDGVEVTANSSKYGIDENETTENGSATFTFDLSDANTSGEIDLSAPFDGVDTEAAIDVGGFEFTVKSDQLQAGSSGTITAVVENASGDGVEGVEVVASGEPIDGESSFDETATAGEYELEVTPSSSGTITVSAPELDLSDEVHVDEAGGGNGGNTGGGTGGGGGGGGGGAAPAPSPDMNVTDVDLSATEIEVGETVNVTVTVTNEGDADGEYDVRVKANTVTVGNETVAVAEGETKEVTVSVQFFHAGERTIAVDGVKGGKVVIEGIEPEDLPDRTTAADTRLVLDADRDVNGTVVEFDGNVTVDALVFPNASDGTATVADLESLPENLSVAPGELVQALEIEVPTELENESATIRLSLSEAQYDGDADRIRLARFHEDSVQVLEPDAVEEADGELVYEFETPGFSTFAVFAQETEDSQVAETPQSTDDSTTETDTGSDTEEAGFDTLGVVAIAFIALIAAVLAAAGARIYQQNGL